MTAGGAICYPPPLCIAQVSTGPRELSSRRRAAVPNPGRFTRGGSLVPLVEGLEPQTDGEPNPSVGVPLTCGQFCGVGDLVRHDQLHTADGVVLRRHVVSVEVELVVVVQVAERDEGERLQRTAQLVQATIERGDIQTSTLHQPVADAPAVDDESPALGVELAAQATGV